MILRFAALSKGSSQNNLLSPREIKVVALMARDQGNKDIVRELFISEATVRTQIIYMVPFFRVKRGFAGLIPHLPPRPLEHSPFQGVQGVYLR